MPPSWPLESRDIVCEESSEHGPVTVTVRPAAVNEYLRGRPNKISTTRFSLLTWLPKSLFIQFQRVANVYFLIVSILVCLPFSPVMWASTALPFCGVLLWTALKDLYEDRKRQRDDDEMNLQTCLRFDLRTKKFVPIKYQEVLVGDFILSFAEDSFPADMMVLAADGGQAFISTMSLDGETNLKERRAPALCSAVTSCKIASGTAYFGKMGTASTFDIGVASQVLEEVDAAHLEADEADRIRRFSYNEKASDMKEMRLVRKPSQEDMRAHAKLEAEALAAAFVLRQGLEVKLDMPKVAISEFNGSVSLTAATPAAKRRMAQLKVAEESFLSSENFVPRGCKLQQTVWLLSVVAYTGPESKVWMNSAEVEAKTSNLQVALNRCVLGLVVTLFVFCLYSASMGQAIGEDAGADFPKRFVIYWIILYQIVPISLYVVFEMVKLLLGIAINRDPDMVDPTTGVHAVARTTDLVEEMGQVEHIFSDKTGTLTQNEMRFARCYIRGKDPGDFRPGFKEEETRAAPVGGHEGFASGLLPCGVLESQKILRDSRNPHCQDFLAFFLCLAVCSDVQVEYEGEGTKPKYEGSSADEVAFLEASHEAGVSLQARVAMPGSSGAELEIKRPDGSCQAAKILCTLPFDSDRKRMTVVCEYEGGLLCVTKGADMVMAPLCSGIDEDVWDQLKAYSNLGLRTLVIAHKALDRAEFEEWQLEYESARNASSADRDRLMTECSAKMEHSLKLAGITALEDRLQDGVPEAIATLKAMGIQIWMLTGDKTETAIEIAKSCSLLLKDQKLIKLVDAKSDEDCIAMLQAAHAHLCSKANEGEALVMDGAFLLRVSRIAEGDAATAVPKSLMPHMSKSAEREAEAKLLAAGEWQMLVELATSASACVCCRLSPRQKRSLVEMVKHRGGGRTITLAIGDGANDVAMIQGAHVGVAVRGREGTQAVLASDVAISQFRFLLPLLQCHGRRAYRRISLYLCYFIYKHVALSVGDLLWAHQDKFRGNIAYPEWLSSGYPVVFTALPIVIIIVLDVDLPNSLAIQIPALYAAGQQRIHFNGRVFSAWVISGVWHGTLAWIVPSLVVHNGAASDEDRNFWIGSLVSFTLVMTHVTLRLWLVAQNTFAGFTILVLLLSMMLYCIAVIVLGHTLLGEWMQPNLQGIPRDVFKDNRALAALFITPFALLLDVVGFKLTAYFRPTPLDTARRQNNGRILPFLQ